MALRRGRFWPGGRHLRRKAASAATLALAAALAGTVAACSPIETWRDLNGLNKNDPDPATAPFSGNMATADAAPYPNLATVPPPPTRATSTAERQKLTEGLIADRTATAAAGVVAPPAPATPAPAPPAPPKKSPLVASAPAAAAPAPAAAAPPPVLPPAVPPPTVPPPPPSPVAAPAPSPVVVPAPPVAAAPAPPVAAAPAPPAPAAPVAEAPPAAATAVPPPGKQATNAATTNRHFQGQPAEVPPTDSSLEMPQVRMRPEPEAPRPPLPPASLRTVVPPAPAAPTPAEAVASAAPTPAPPVPALMPVAPPPAVVIPPEARRPAAATTVATLRLADAAAPTNQIDRAEIDRVAALYREKPGSVRVLAFAAAPTGGGDPLASYHAALGHAQQIAKALADAGIPANKIQTEAAPSPLAAGRVDIQFAP